MLALGHYRAALMLATRAKSWGLRRSPHFRLIARRVYEAKKFDFRQLTFSPD